MKLKWNWLPLWPSLTVALAVVLFATWAAPAQQLEMAEPTIERAWNPPLMGTFYLIHQKHGPPYPFDPYGGRLPVYEWKPGVFLIDDVEFAAAALPSKSGQSAQAEGGGGGLSMSMMSSTGPGGFPVGGSGGGELICAASTNFTLAYRYWTNSLALDVALGTNSTIDLTVLTSTTNALYDLFGTTNLNSLALPQLSRTNWQWLLRVTNSSISFTWGDTNWCAAWFQLGTMLDTDGDSLTDAYENLVSHTSASNPDSDGDGILDGVEVQYGLNPRVADPPFTISIMQPAGNSLLP